MEPAVYFKQPSACQSTAWASHAHKSCQVSPCGRCSTQGAVECLLHLSAMCRAGTHTTKHKLTGHQCSDCDTQIDWIHSGTLVTGSWPEWHENHLPQ